MDKVMPLLLTLIFLATSMSAQINGKIVEFLSGSPIPDVIVKTEKEKAQSDANGYFTLKNSAQRVSFYKPGFQELTIDLKQNKKEWVVQLQHDVVELDELVVYGEPLTIDAIFKRVVDSAHGNYISSRTPLEYNFQTSLNTIDNQSIFHFSKAIILYNKNPKKKAVLSYHNWYNSDDDSIHYDQSFNKKLKENYSNTYSQLGNNNRSLISDLPGNYSSNANAYLSTFNIEGVYYYNILLIAKKPIDIKIRNIDRSLLSQEQRDRMENTALIRLSNYQIRADNFALVNYQTFALSADQFSLEALNNITDDRRLYSWIADNVSNSNFYFHHTLNFKQLPESKQYYLDYRNIRDNILLWNLKEQYDDNLIFFESYRFISECSEAGVSKTRKFVPDDYINFRLKELGVN